MWKGHCQCGKLVFMYSYKYIVIMYIYSCLLKENQIKQKVHEKHSIFALHYFIQTVYSVFDLCSALLFFIS